MTICISTALRPLLPALAAVAVTLAGCAPNLPPPQAPSQQQPAAQAPTPVTPQPGADLTQPAQSQQAKAALLLPLSGQNAGVGRSLMQAAEMGVFDSAGDDFSLVVRDSAAATGPGGAVSSAMQEGVGLVLGPVFSTEAPAAGSAAGGVIPVISFSNDRNAAKPGLFVLGLAPQAQVERVVQYAAGKDVKRFAILYPSSAYGNVVRQAYQDAVVQAGGEIALMQAYDPAQGDLMPTMQKLVDSYKSSGFDALMIPEGGQRLRAIVAMLPGFGIPIAGPGGGPQPCRGEAPGRRLVRQHAARPLGQLRAALPVGLWLGAGCPRRRGL